MASTRREKELARLRAERQAARRAAEAAKRKRRNAIVASALAVVVVVAAVAFLTTRGGKDDKAAPTAAGTCTYDKSGDASRPVELPPSEPVTRDPVTADLATDQGPISFTLDTAKAPCASGALISLAAQKFYDATPCHRLTTSGIFVLQCGDPTGTGSGGPGYQYKEEDLTGATYKRGTVAMAKSSDPGTTGSQFFLVYKDSELPPEYTPVGTITQGLDVIDKVAAAGSEPADDGKPKLAINITTFTTTAPAAAPTEPAGPAPTGSAAPEPSASATP